VTALNILTQQIGLPGWLAQARFSSFEPRKAWPQAMDAWSACVQYAGGILPGAEIDAQRNWLVLCGNYGTGKSHLAAAIAFDVALSGQPARFIPWVAQLDALRDSFGQRGDVSGRLMRAFTAPYLVAIDDIDKEQATPWTQRTLYRIINHRYNHNLPLVLTLNHALESDTVRQIMPPAVFDRVLERVWRVISFDGPSYRSGLTLT